MRSTAIIVLLALFGSGPCAAGHLFSTPIRDAAVNHDLARVRKTQENISNRAEADSTSASENQDGTNSAAHSRAIAGDGVHR
jgi:hypothetical protein